MSRDANFFVKVHWSYYVACKLVKFLVYDLDPFSRLKTKINPKFLVLFTSYLQVSHPCIKYSTYLTAHTHSTQSQVNKVNERASVHVPNLKIKKRGNEAQEKKK